MRARGFIYGLAQRETGQCVSHPELCTLKKNSSLLPERKLSFLQTLEKHSVNLTAAVTLGYWAILSHNMMMITFPRLAEAM